MKKIIQQDSEEKMGLEDLPDLNKDDSREGYYEIAEIEYINTWISSKPIKKMFYVEGVLDTCSYGNGIERGILVRESLSDNSWESCCYFIQIEKIINYKKLEVEKKKSN
jgi:hypothetical protein